MRLSPQARCTLPMGSCEAGNRWFVDSPLEGDGFEPLVPRHEILGIPAGLRRRQSEPHPPLGSAQAGRERPVRRRRRRARDDAGVLCASDVLLRDPPGRQKLDQVAVIRGRDKSLPPGATRYARHFDHTPICKKSFDMSSFARVNCRFIIGRTISVLWREHQEASIMKIVFFRWVGVDSVAPAPDYLDRQNADCGAASRFYRRGVAFRFQNRRAPSQSRYGTSRRCRPGLDHPLHDTACATYIGGCELFQCR